MKYKVGDKVRVRSWEAMEREFGRVGSSVNVPGMGFNKYMRKYCGQIVTIKSECSSYYHISEENPAYNWTDDMFEGYAFNYGEKIEVSDDGSKWGKSIYVGYIDGKKYPYIVVNQVHKEAFAVGEKFSTCGWAYARPIQKQPEVSIKIEVNGKPVTEPMSEETARRWGIIK